MKYIFVIIGFIILLVMFSVIICIKKCNRTNVIVHSVPINDVTAHNKYESSIGISTHHNTIHTIQNPLPLVL